MGKLTMFFGFVWVITSIAGGMLLGSVPFASSSLTEDLSAAGTTITVTSTSGFPAPGIIVIGDERIAYSATSATTFTGTLVKPLQRGASGTDNVVHVEGDSVRMLEGSMINSSIDYDLAIIADAAGAQAFLSVPTAIFSIILSFGVAPFAFLGTDLQIITIIWSILFLGMIVSFFISVAGGRSYLSR